MDKQNAVRLAVKCCIMPFLVRLFAVYIYAISDFCTVLSYDTKSFIARFMIADFIISAVCFADVQYKIDKQYRED